ncbi:MAG TPA: GNAT family N-acetyltransferase [Blastocatellia bacterium]|nr:GNAT family N-acetyltransferase [Blastocatellia bacterium]
MWVSYLKLFRSQGRWRRRDYALSNAALTSVPAERAEKGSITKSGKASSQRRVRLIGGLAVDRTCQGQRLMEYLLMDCFQRILKASQLIAVHAIVVNATDERVKSFYRKYGFTAFTQLLMIAERRQRGDG